MAMNLISLFQYLSTIKSTQKHLRFTMSYLNGVVIVIIRNQNKRAPTLYGYRT